MYVIQAKCSLQETFPITQLTVWGMSEEAFWVEAKSPANICSESILLNDSIVWRVLQNSIPRV